MNITDLYNMDCRDAMSLFIPDNSVDAIVCDPPYGLAFMGKKWDYDVPGVDIWAECLRVLKPGGYLLSFASPRTYHRMACGIEDAGFDIRDQIMWLFGSGFPKSHNLQDEWEGWGTALKPAHEPIAMARKPLAKGHTVAASMQAHGTGALNIAECRVGEQLVEKGRAGRNECESESFGKKLMGTESPQWQTGRWPANLIHDGSSEVVEAFPQSKVQQGAISGAAPSPKTSNIYGAMRREGEASAGSENAGAVGFKMRPGMRRTDGGSAARFFYCAKASKKDRDEGLGHIEATERVNGNKWTDQDYRVANGERSEGRESGPRKNIHPTVKPTDLMAYLCRLVTPPGGVVFDPFMGSGSTGKAALREGFGFIGCEMDEAYFNIAQARIDAVKAEQKDSPT